MVHAVTSPKSSNAIPLCVDLDGTLIRSDMLIESALSLIARNPLMLFAMLIWLMSGKANLKRQIARRVTVDPSLLPYNEPLMTWLIGQARSRVLVLSTASDILLAKPIADYVGFFSEVMASDGTHNLSGANKAQLLAERYGDRGFDYVGNEKSDLPVWSRARAAIVVESGQRLSTEAAKVSKLERRFILPQAGIRTWLKALRTHQWLKNVLVFLPLLAAHRVFEIDAVIRALLAFLCFGLCASSVYLTNDLLDLSSDRQHHSKRNRPFAAGTIPLVQGPIAALALLVAGFALASAISTIFSIVLLGYYVLTTAYSLRLKRVMMMDVIVLALLYTSRIIAGAAAIKTTPSFWLLAFSMFIFLSLAMIKRYAELLAMQKAGKVQVSGRGYNVDDIPLVQSLGGSSGYLAVLVLAMYIDSTASESLYRHPHYLWLLCPLLLYWVSRIWAIAHRGAMHDDPVVFAAMDNTSRILVMLAAIIVFAAI